MTDCNRCRKEIKFDGLIRSSSGKMVPLEMNGEKHDCPEYKKGMSSQASQKFVDNKARYGQPYSGPSQNHQMQTDLADAVVRLDAHELRIKELERTLSGLDSAIAKLSMSKASDLVEPVDESTN